MAPTRAQEDPLLDTFLRTLRGNGPQNPVGYKYSIRRPHRASNHTARPNRCQRATTGGVQRQEGNPPADRARNAGATQQTCRGQVRRQDEGEQGSVRHEVARRRVVGDAQPRFGRACAAWGCRALPERAPADHQSVPDRQEPWGEAPGRAGVSCYIRRRRRRARLAPSPIIQVPRVHTPRRRAGASLKLPSANLASGPQRGKAAT